MARGTPLTLADGIIRQCLSMKGWMIGGEAFARRVAEARKFVMDDSMSAFLADIGSPHRLTDDPAGRIEAMRFLSRLPHRTTWIEYDARVRMSRAVEIATRYAIRGPEEIPDRLGWLCMQHPTVDTAFMAIECSSQVFDIDNSIMETPQPHYLAYVWSTEDQPLPYDRMGGDLLMTMDGSPGKTRTVGIESVLLGHADYTSPFVGIIPSPFLTAEVSRGMLKNAGDKFNPLQELAGDLRYLWAFLSTINDLPVAFRDVRPSKGYFAKGRYRKFSEHRVITLTVPTARATTILDRVQALARRKRHMVRGHWRETLRGRRWIPEHERGDAKLGFVIHDYSVERFKKKKKKNR